MPVKVQHKDTDKIYEIPIKEWNSQKYFKSNYKVLSQTDIVHVKMVNRRMQGGRQDMGLWERSDYLKEAEANPNLYFCQPVEDINNEPSKPNVIHEITLNDVALMNGHRLNQLRDAGLLDNHPSENPIVTTKTDQTKKSYPRAWIIKIFNKIIDSTLLLVITILGTVVGALLVIAIVNYYKGKGFNLK